MTTNPGVEYFAAKEKYENAKTNPEKLQYLQEMLKFAPRHKASEKLVAGLTSKIARFKEDMEKQKAQAKKSSGSSINVKKEGGGQIVIMGLPNTGKSTLLKQLTGVNVEIASYPFTTTEPVIGAMDYKGAKIQLVEVPAIVEGSSEGKANGTKLLGLARNADAIIITYSTEEEKQIVVKELELSGIIVDHQKPKIIIKQSDYKGLDISGKQRLKMSEQEFEQTLKSFGIHNASILVEEEIDLAKLMEALDDSLEYKNCLFVNVKKGFGTEHMKEQIFPLLEKIIVYTKKPGGDADYSSPLLLRKNATVNDVAEFVHKEMAKKLKFAKVWGSTKYPGQRVSKEHELKSGDVVELM